MDSTEPCDCKAIGRAGATVVPPVVPDDAIELLAVWAHLVESDRDALIAVAREMVCQLSKTLSDSLKDALPGAQSRPN